MNRDDLVFDEMDSPIGRLRLIADDNGLRRVCFERDRHPRADDANGRRDASRLAAARTQLQEYFAGARRDFDLVLNPVGTPFQCRVWNALGDIAYGTTISYAELADRIGNPAARRAVGAANGRNPLPIIVPCHRVIGRDGRLVGFGGGLQNKAMLLALECPPRSERRAGGDERQRA
jgi:methylated-DNA-[protein]-cysteine S-methyltransferase